MGTKRCRGGTCRPSSSAMTLTELLVVVAVIAILVTLLIPTAGAFMERMADTRCKSNLNNISQALHVGKGGMPAVADWTAAVVANATPAILACPKGGDRYTFPAPAPAGQSPATPPQVPLSVAVSGGMKMIATPTTLNTYSGTQSIVFPERKNVTLGANLAVAFTTDFESMMYDIQPNQIVPAGTKVDSYFMYYCDPWAPWGPHWADRPATFTVTGGKVVGIIAGDYVGPALYASDPIVGNPGTNYNAFYFGSWISLNGDDALRLSNSGTTLEILSTGCWGGYIDNWRVLVSEVATGGGGGGGPVMVNWPGNYGMNNQVAQGSTVRPEQLIVTDYDSAVIDPDGNHQDVLNKIVDEERIRHSGKMNALMGNGTVRAVTPDELKSTADFWKP